jgi:ubiquinone/menaquinone biosynthesis C-methylase UbiE
MPKDLSQLNIFSKNVELVNGVYVNDFSDKEVDGDKIQTNAAFSTKWAALKENDDDNESWKNFGKNWYLKLYGFENEDNLKTFLSDKSLIIDAGCGKGYKAAWFAKLSPNSTVIGVDFSTSVFEAANRYKDIENLYFTRSDIANMPFNESCADFINCDQVVHHTPNPPKTIKEFRRVLKKDMFLCNYVYAKKALPRELLDEHFRSESHNLTDEQLWSLSKKLTELGKLLSDLKITIDFPEIKELGIKGGKQDLQRFFYWNFLKCFWSEEFGYEASVSCNFDWYAPSIAFRYSREEFLAMSKGAGFKNTFLHAEEACYSGLFKAS